MKVLITGFPGTGKTTIAHTLKERGRTAYDPQSMSSYMHVENKMTGKHAKQPRPVPSGWYDAVADYNWDSVKLQSLIQNREDIYICSLASNQSQFYNLFDKIVLLTLDDRTHTKRLLERGGDHLGSNNLEIHDILQHKKHFERSLVNLGVIQISSAQPLDAVVDEIIKLR